MELSILNMPVALVILGAAFFLAVYDKLESAGGAITMISVVLSVLGCAYAVYMGASLREAAAILMVFLIVELGVKDK